MAAISKPTFFLAPNCDFPPDGLITLGSIIVNPKSPEKSLNFQKHQRIPIPAEDLQESFKENWQESVGTSKEGRITLWAGFLQTILGLGADVSVARERRCEDIYRFRRLDTKYFQPGAAYLRESLSQEEVMAYLRATRFHEPVSMVTGVKIARGAQVHSSTLKSYQQTLGVGVDATIFTGVPISTGPEVEIGTSKGREVSFGGSSDYVFAYRLLKIQVRKDGDVKSQKDYNKGALFSLEGGKDGKLKEHILQNLSIDQVDLADADIGTATANTFEAFEDDEDVIIVATA